MAQKVIVLYQTLSGNTKKIAEGIADGLNIKAIHLDDVTDEVFRDAEVLFLGSGIYGGQHHRLIIESVSRINPATKVYIFSTAGLPFCRFIWHKKIKLTLGERKIKIVGEMCFKGFDTFGPLRFLGGINKNRPNAEDINEARQIGKKCLDKAKSLPRP